jgi:hypothetical protein
MQPGDRTQTAPADGDERTFILLICVEVQVVGFSIYVLVKVCVFEFRKGCERGIKVVHGRRWRKTWVPKGKMDQRGKGIMCFGWGEGIVPIMGAKYTYDNKWRDDSVRQ